MHIEIHVWKPFIIPCMCMCPKKTTWDWISYMELILQKIIESLKKQLNNFLLYLFRVGVYMCQVCGEEELPGVTSFFHDVNPCDSTQVSGLMATIFS